MACPAVFSAAQNKLERHGKEHLAGNKTAPHCLFRQTHEDAEETLRKAKTAAASAVGCSHVCHAQKSRAAKAYVSQGKRYGIEAQNVWF